jgi:hypothetical protein
LGDAEVSSGNGKVRVVVDFHYDGGTNPILPQVIAESLAEGVTGNA